MNPKVIQQVAPPHSWYLQDFAGSRIWYDNPDTIYRFVGVNNASSYVITGRFNGGLPADTNFSVLTGLSGNTASNLNGRDLDHRPRRYVHHHRQRRSRPRPARKTIFNSPPAQR